MEKCSFCENSKKKLLYVYQSDVKTVHGIWKHLEIVSEI